MRREKAYDWEMNKAERVFGWIVYSSFFISLIWLAGGMVR